MGGNTEGVKLPPSRARTDPGRHPARRRPSRSAGRVRTLPAVHSTPPYGVAPLRFPTPALATLVGRAGLGGAREVALAMFVAARLARSVLPPTALDVRVRHTRATAARTWAAALMLPPDVRVPVARLLDATGAADPGDVANAVRASLLAVTRYLNESSVVELEALHAALARSAR